MSNIPKQKAASSELLATLLGDRHAPVPATPTISIHIAEGATVHLVVSSTPAVAAAPKSDPSAV